MLNFVIPDFYPAAAEILLLVMLCAILLVDLVLPESKRWWIAFLTQVTLVGGALISYVMLVDGQVVLTFSNMFVSDSLGSLLKLLTLVSVMFVVIYKRGR